MEFNEGNRIDIDMNPDMDMTKLKIAAKGNGASVIDQEPGDVEIPENLSHETVDAFSFFGGNKEKKENNGNGDPPKEDDGDSKGFW